MYVDARLKVVFHKIISRPYISQGAETWNLRPCR